GSGSPRYFFKQYAPGADIGPDGVALLNSVSHHVHPAERDDGKPVGVPREIEPPDTSSCGEYEPALPHQPDGLPNLIHCGCGDLADVCKRDTRPGCHQPVDRCESG